MQTVTIAYIFFLTNFAIVIKSERTVAPRLGIAHRYYYYYYCCWRHSARVGLCIGIHPFAPLTPPPSPRFAGLLTTSRFLTSTVVATTRRQAAAESPPPSRPSLRCVRKPPPNCATISMLKSCFFALPERKRKMLPE